MDRGALPGMHPVRVSRAISEIRRKMAEVTANRETMAELKEGILNR